MKMRKLFTLAIASFLVTTTAFSMSHKKQDIVDVASKAGSFNTLIAAAKAAGLVDALKGDGPLTVFAPTDDAFAELSESIVSWSKYCCLLYTSPSPRDATLSRMPSSA